MLALTFPGAGSPTSVHERGSFRTPELHPIRRELRVLTYQTLL